MQPRKIICFGYDKDKDQFICPADKRFHFVNETCYTTDNSYVTQRRNYECHDCQECPFRKQCTKDKGNRKIRISFGLLEHPRQARESLTSMEGKRLRAARSIEVETVFGHVKHSMGFRRFHPRGLEKVKTEWELVSIAHNMKILATQ